MSNFLKTFIFFLPVFALSNGFSQESLMAIEQSAKSDPRLMALYQQIRKLQISVEEMQKSNENIPALYEMVLQVENHIKDVDERFSNLMDVYSSKLAAYEPLKALPDKTEGLERKVEAFSSYQENYQKIVSLIHHLDLRSKKIADEFVLINNQLKETSSKAENNLAETTSLAKELESVNRGVAELQKNFTTLSAVPQEIDQLGMKTEVIEHQMNQQNEQQSVQFSQSIGVLLSQIHDLEARLAKEESKAAHLTFDYNWVLAEMEKMKTYVNQLEKKR